MNNILMKQLQKDYDTLDKKVDEHYEKWEKKFDDLHKSK